MGRSSITVEGAVSRITCSARVAGRLYRDARPLAAATSVLRAEHGTGGNGIRFVVPRAHHRHERRSVRADEQQRRESTAGRHRQRGTLLVSGRDTLSVAVAADRRSSAKKSSGWSTCIPRQARHEERGASARTADW